MGRDKSLIVYHKGLTQRDYMIDLLSKSLPKVFLACKADQPVPPGIQIILDQYIVEGPINGILSAFKTYTDKAWLTIAIDMPFIDEHAINLLIKERDESKVATCFYNEQQKFPEPLFTIWEPQAYPLLLTYVERGQVSPRNFLQQHNVKLIRNYDQKILTNINSPDEIPPLPFDL